MGRSVRKSSNLSSVAHAGNFVFYSTPGVEGGTGFNASGDASYTYLGIALNKNNELKKVFRKIIARIICFLLLMVLLNDSLPTFG